MGILQWSRVQAARWARLTTIKEAMRSLASPFANAPSFVAVSIRRVPRTQECKYLPLLASLATSLMSTVSFRMSTTRSATCWTGGKAVQ